MDDAIRARWGSHWEDIEDDWNFFPVGHTYNPYPGPEEDTTTLSAFEAALHDSTFPSFTSPPRPQDTIFSSDSLDPPPAHLPHALDSAANTRPRTDSLSHSLALPPTTNNNATTHTPHSPHDDPLDHSPNHLPPPAPIENHPHWLDAAATSAFTFADLPQSFNQPPQDFFECLHSAGSAQSPTSPILQSRYQDWRTLSEEDMPLNGLRSQRRDWRLESGGLIEESLPHTTQRRNLRSNDGGVVDLTTEPEHAAASPYLVGAPNEANSRVAGVKRKAEEEAEHTPRPASQRSANHASSSTTTTTKRPKLTTSPPSHPPDQPIETLDLTGAAPPFPSTSHPATTTTTTTSTTQKPPRISALTCIICMEPFTNATTTSCGHIYCH
ncbi:hypothetical protein LTS02_009402, partial [Friedmanniomyces endolithicus]